MLKTRSGKAMPPELVLQTVMCMDYEPGMIEKIMETSRDFREMLLGYEHSIARKMAAPLYQNPTPYIRSSSPDRSWLSHSTYPWLHEMHTRYKTASLLKPGPLFHLPDSVLALGDKLKCCLRERILVILYEISDLGGHNRNAFRDAQEAWVHSEDRTPEDLAILYGMINTASDQWRTIKDAQALSLWLKQNPQKPDPEYPDLPPLIPVISHAELAQQSDEECIYREGCLHYGPCFLQASISEGARDQAWFEQVMSNGLEAMRLFEEGRGGGDCRSSLQGFIIRRFCEMVGCHIMQGWVEVWRIIAGLPVRIE